MKENRCIGFIAMIFALILTVMPMALALGEAQPAGEEKPAELIDLFKIDYEITDPEYDAMYEHRYVSDDGKEERWYFSYLPEIDGLKRTDEKRKIESCKWVDDGSSDFEGDYAYLYMCRETGYLMPFKHTTGGQLSSSGNYTMTFQGHHYLRLKDIVKISDEAMQILHDYDLHRLNDDIFNLKYNLSLFLEAGKAGLAYLEPLSIENDTMTLKIHAITDKDGGYDHDTMNGMLVYADGNSVNKDYFTATEEEKTITLKKK